jgi:hypothetical protein
MRNKILRIYDDFDGLILPDPKIYCTYCWMVHYGSRPCGPDAIFGQWEETYAVGPRK